MCWEYTINDSDRNGLLPGGITPPGPTLHQAYAGEKMPISATPADMHPRLGADELGVEAIQAAEPRSTASATAGITPP